MAETDHVGRGISLAQESRPYILNICLAMNCFSSADPGLWVNPYIHRLPISPR